MGTSQDKIMKYLVDVAKNNGPGLVEIVWYHDDWCPSSDGTHGIGSCICDPNPEVLKPSRKDRRHPKK
jgi:hypothetical protein